MREKRIVEKTYSKYTIIWQRRPKAGMKHSRRSHEFAAIDGTSHVQGIRGHESIGRPVY